MPQKIFTKETDDSFKGHSQLILQARVRENDQSWVIFRKDSVVTRDIAQFYQLPDGVVATLSALQLQ